MNKIVVNEISLKVLLKLLRRAEGKLYQVKGTLDLINEIDYAIYCIGKETNEFQPDQQKAFIREIRLKEQEKLIHETSQDILSQ